MENILDSYKRVCRGKKNRTATIQYEMHKLQRLYDLKKTLDNMTYTLTLDDLNQFEVFEPKRRMVVANGFEDKIVQDVLSKQVLARVIAPKLIYDNVASQPGKGTKVALDRLQRYMMIHAKSVNWTNKGWVLNCDLRKYFYMIDHEVFIKMLEKLPIDDKLKHYLKMQVDLCVPEINPYTDEEGKGLCIGFETSQWSAVYYLNGLDHFIKEKLHIKCYGRYMDDFYLIHEDRKYLEYCLEEIKKYLKDNLKMELNDKTHITPFAQGVCFLGYRMEYNPKTHQVDNRIRQKSFKRMMKRVAKLKILASMGKIADDIPEISYRAWEASTARDKSYAADNRRKKARAFVETIHPKPRIQDYQRELYDDRNHDTGGFFILRPTKKRLEELSHDEEGFYRLVPHRESMQEIKDRDKIAKMQENPQKVFDKNFELLMTNYDKAIMMAKHRAKVDSGILIHAKKRGKNDKRTEEERKKDSKVATDKYLSVLFGLNEI